ncbi:MAG: DMT family transporter [Paludibacteraceae bacterium]|nr:DMT family transporter [Paludibacteraceae bacterium]
MIIWAGSGIAVKAALTALSPLALILARFTIAVLLMLVIGLSCRGNSVLGLQRVQRGDWWLFLLGGFFEPFIYFILETYTYDSFATPTLAEVFLSTNPLMAPVFAWLFLREKVTIYNVLGIIVSTAGMLVLVLAGTDSLAIGSRIGVPLALITVSAAVGYSITLKKVPARYSSLSVVFWGQFSGLAMFIVLSLITLLLDPLHLPFLRFFRLTAAPMSALSILGVGYLAVFSSVAAFILFCYCVRFVGVTKANIFNNIRPVFTAILMLLLYNEHLPLIKWVGIAIIILGLFICQKREKNADS